MGTLNVATLSYNGIYRTSRKEGVFIVDDSYELKFVHLLAVVLLLKTRDNCLCAHNQLAVWRLQVFVHLTTKQKEQNYDKKCTE